LPLNPVGFHNPDANSPIPADPELPSGSQTTTEAAGEPSISVGVDPVEAMPTDRPVINGDKDSPSNENTSPTDNNDDHDESEDEEESRIGKLEKGIKGFWDWITEQVDKIFGNGSGSSGS
jgi:hypothetical protein